jgi:hypothetical protein
MKKFNIWGLEFTPWGLAKLIIESLFAAAGLYVFVLVILAFGGALIK